MQGTQFAGFVTRSADNLLFSNNVSPKADVITNIVTNDLDPQTIQIGYSILSNVPEDVNKAVKTGSCFVKKVYMTQAIDTTLRGELVNDEIPFWSTSDDKIPRKVVFSGFEDNEVSSNHKLFTVQLATLQKTIYEWLHKTSYAGPFPSNLVSFNMGNYDVHLSMPNMPLDESLVYKASSCQELLRLLKSEFTNELASIPKYDTANCENMPWNVFKKRTIFEVMTSVNSIINSPVAKSQDGEKFISTLHSTYGPTAGEPYDVDAVSVYETLNLTACNYVRMQYSVFVDAFEPNEDLPVLLQLVLNTDFYFEMKEKDCGCDKLLNPDVQVNFPLSTGY